MAEPGFPTAACVAVGTELLGEHKLDRNSLDVTRVLDGCGVEVVEKRVVADQEDRIAAAVRELVRQVDVVILTGGLGPTADDVTRPAVAAALGRGLRRDPRLVEWLRRRYAERNREMPAPAAVMADVIDGAEPLLNQGGAAPGQLIDVEGRLVVLLPGVSWEMAEMLRHRVVPALEERLGTTRRRVRRTLLATGVLESQVEARVHTLYDTFGRENITILASRGQVRLLLTAAGAGDAAVRRLDRMEAAFREALGDDVAGVDVGSMEEALLQLLRGEGHSLATAESCTGGLVGARLTEVPGSSDVYLGGVVSYTNDAKERFLDVPHQVLVQHGAVSEPVARAMASGVRRRFGATWGLGITGIAGPGGGTDDKPVGLVHWAVAGPGEVWHGVRVFPGPRSVVRHFSATMALDLLRRRLLAGEGSG